MRIFYQDSWSNRLYWYLLNGVPIDMKIFYQDSWSNGYILNGLQTRETQKRMFKYEWGVGSVSPKF